MAGMAGRTEATLIQPRKTIVHKHSNINWPKDYDETIPFSKDDVDAIIDAASETMIKTALLSFAIGLVAGLILGWILS